MQVNNTISSSIKKTLIIILISIVTFMFFISRPVVFEPSGDALFNLISAGVFGNDNEYVLFSNIILGFLLKYLYILIPKINWYLWLMLISELVSLISVSYAITRKCNLINTILLSTIINLFIGGECFTDVQFTVAAMICSSSGLMLISVGMEDKSKGMKCSGVLLYFLGFLWRTECAIMVLPFFIAWILIKLLSGKRKVLSIGIIAVTLLLCLSAYAFNHMAYSRGEWKQYTEHSYYRAAIIDHTPVFYIPGVYDEIGVTEAEADYFRNWYFADPDKMPLSKLKDLYNLQYSGGDYSLRISVDVLRKTFLAVKACVKERIFPWLYIMTFFVSIIVGVLSKNKKMIMLMLASVGMIMGIYWYFICINRVVWRVEIGAWLAGLLIIIPDTLDCISNICNTVQEKLTERINSSLRRVYTIVSYVLIGFISLRLVYGYISVRNTDRYSDYENYYELFDGLKDRDGLYLGSLMVGSLRIYDSPYGIDGTYKGLFSNYVQYGGIVYWAGFNVDKLYANDIYNPTTALFERDDVYYISYDWEADNLLDYLHKEYDENIYVEKIDEWKDVSIWKYKRSK